MREGELFAGVGAVVYGGGAGGDGGGAGVEAVAEVSPSDVEGLCGERLAVREFTTGETRVMARDERWPVSLQPFDFRFFVMTPIVDGFAALGLAGKYVSPKTVLGCEVSGDCAVVTLAEGGRFVAYSERSVKAVLVGGKDVGFEQVGGWFFVDTADNEITLRWQIRLRS